jgi:predicted nucleic acid-binding protein
LRLYVRGGGVPQQLLLDASALYPAVLEPRRFAPLLADAAILDLTVYEVGNAGLIMARRGLLRDYRAFMGALRKLVGLVKIIRVDAADAPGIAALAEETGLTFYDASYVYYARKTGRLLVTDDREIIRKAGDVALTVEEALEKLQ